MKNITAAAAAAAFLLCTGWAHAQAGKTITRDELRACMDTEDSIAKRKPAVEAGLKDARAEIDSLKPEAKELEEERVKLEQDGWPSRLQERFERKVKAHNNKSQVANDKLAAAQKQLTELNGAVKGYNDKCVGVSFLPSDKEAILKERGAK
jgi:chromosome segregation ATPase